MNESEVNSEKIGSLIPNRREFLKLTGAVGGGALLGGNSASASEDLVEQSMFPDANERPEVRVIATGGTIASTEEAAEDGGYSRSEGGEQIVAAVPLLEEFVDISFESVADKGSSSLLVEDYVEVAKAAMRAESEGIDGVLVTHGTDAIEEDAFFNDLVLDLDIPVAFVGAMRAGDAVGADGPRNLLSAVRLCTRSEFHLTKEPSGVYVVLNEKIHAARDVTKTHTTKVETFDSGPAGPVGVFTDNELLLYREPGSYTANLSHYDLDAVPEMVVPIVATGAGTEAYVTEQAVAGEYDVDGIVIQATGWWGGTAPSVSEATQEALDAGIPVARTTRVHWGPMNPGYSDDREGEIVVMEDLPSWKARLQAMVALTMTENHPGYDDDLEMLRKTAQESKYAVDVVAPSTL